MHRLFTNMLSFKVKRDSERWTHFVSFYGLNSIGASTHARQLVAVFQVLCSRYGLTCVGYAQNSLEFVSRSPLIHVVGRSFCNYTDSLLKLVIPTTNALPRWRLNVETKTKRTLYNSRRLSFNELTKAKTLVLHSSHFALNWRCCTTLGERSSGGIWKFRTSSFKCYVDHSHTMYSSGNIDVRNWVHFLNHAVFLQCWKFFR